MMGMMAVVAVLALSVAPLPEEFPAPSPGCPGCASASEESLGEATSPRPPRCPYGFRSQMPPGVFCVYQGTAFGPDGQPCAKEVWAIWSSYSEGSTDQVAAQEDGEPSGAVAVGLLSQPEMVFRGEPDRADSNRAGFRGYFVGDDPKLYPSHGYATLQQGGEGSAGGTRLTLSFSGPEVPRYEGCPLSSYEGSLIGVLGDSEEAPPGRMVREDKTGAPSAGLPATVAP